MTICKVIAQNSMPTEFMVNCHTLAGQPYYWQNVERISASSDIVSHIHMFLLTKPRYSDRHGTNQRRLSTVSWKFHLKRFSIPTIFANILIGVRIIGEFVSVSTFLAHIVV